MQKRWLINKRYSKKFEKEFPELSAVTLQLLWDRKITNQNLIDEFFNPDYKKDIHNPFLMKNMEKAVKRIFQALEKNERITIYGDYDVDGVTSSAVIVNTLLEIKSVLNQIESEESKKFIDLYIPNRESEGYGLNKKAIEKISKDKTDLIITVDCGVSSFENVQEAVSLGMDVIITDHHHVPEKIPEATAIINPKQKDCQYPFKDLAGVGVAFKLAQALLIKLGEKKIKGKIKLTTGFEKWLLDLVALGTVADCVSLVGENRTLVKYGLLVINKTKRVGLKKLIEISGTKMRENGNVTEIKEIDTTMISFLLAPRLNAAGRINHANTSYNLLTSDNEDEAKELSCKLEKDNQIRQRVTEKMICEIRERVGKLKKIPKVIVESSPDWKIGVVGLVAGKLTDEYSRPFLILQKQKNQSAGSGRSITEFNLIESIEKCKDILVSFGGHSQAAGLKIDNKNIDKFKKQINKIADEVLTESDLTPSIEIDCEIQHREINWKLVDEIKKLKPFGQGNQRPIFIVRKLEVHEIKAVGNNRAHLKLCFKAKLENGKVKYFSAIGFRLGSLIEEMPDGKNGLRWGDIVDIVFQLEINSWNGNRELQMNVLDLKISG